MSQVWGTVAVMVPVAGFFGLWMREVYLGWTSQRREQERIRNLPPGRHTWVPKHSAEVAE